MNRKWGLTLIFIILSIVGSGCESDTNNDDKTVQNDILSSPTNETSQTTESSETNTQNETGTNGESSSTNNSSTVMASIINTTAGFSRDVSLDNTLGKYVSAGDTFFGNPVSANSFAIIFSSWPLTCATETTQAPEFSLNSDGEGYLFAFLAQVDSQGVDKSSVKTMYYKYKIKEGMVTTNGNANKNCSTCNYMSPISFSSESVLSSTVDFSMNTSFEQIGVSGSFEVKFCNN